MDESQTNRDFQVKLNDSVSVWINPALLAWSIKWTEPSEQSGVHPAPSPSLISGPSWHSLCSFCLSPSRTSVDSHPSAETSTPGLQGWTLSSWQTFPGILQDRWLPSGKGFPFGSRSSASSPLDPSVLRSLCEEDCTVTSVREADEREGSLSGDWSFFKWLTTVAALKARCQTQTYLVSPSVPNFHFHQFHKQPETKSVTFPITCSRAADLPVGFCKRSLHLLTHRLVNVDVFSRIPANPASTSVIGQQTREDAWGHSCPTAVLTMRD